MSVGRRHGDRIWQYACEKCGRERLMRCKVGSGEVWSFNPGLVTERVRMELGKSWGFNYQTYVRYSSVSIKNFCCDYVHTDQVDCFHRFARETELHLHDASRRGGEAVSRGSNGASGSSRCMFNSSSKRRRVEEFQVRRHDDAVHSHDVTKSLVVGVSYPGSGAGVQDVTVHAVQDVQDVADDVTTRALIPEHDRWV